MDETEIQRRMDHASKAFRQWSAMPVAERASILNRVAAILLRDKETLAKLITLEMGKTTREAVAEIEKSAWVCTFYAEHAAHFLADITVEAGFHNSIVCFQPTGAVLGIMPWNFPFWQVFRYAAPALAAGNVTLLKHAPNVCGCSKKIETIFLEAGAPAGVFQILIIDTPAVEKIVLQDIVQGVTLTGSERAGSSVASLAGREIKKSVLELGGSDALIILPDADMKVAAATALQSRMQNAGQSCIGAKRFIVLQDAMDDFMQELLLQVQQIKQGDPFDAAMNMGPMARPDLVANLDRQLKTSLQQGASLVQGGSYSGCNFLPTILTNVQPGMASFEEETFGPMAAVITVRDEAAAIMLANSNRYGLGASIWTKDIDKGAALAREIAAGLIFVNSLVKSDPRLPFGGIKKSGYGRELGREGMLEFVNVKTIAVSV